MKKYSDPESIFLTALVCMLVFFAGCKKSSPGTDTTNTNNISAADKIAGNYSGQGKFLPGDISLGYSLICVPPPNNYQSFYQSGTASMVVTKLTDSTVKISISSTAFPQAVYSTIKITENSNEIIFYQGYYDKNSKALVFAGVAPNYSYSYSANCTIGLPYYTSALFPGPTGNPVYYNYTIKRYEFSGIKQ